MEFRWASIVRFMFSREELLWGGEVEEEDEVAMISDED